MNTALPHPTEQTYLELKLPNGHCFPIYARGFLPNTQLNSRPIDKNIWLITMRVTDAIKAELYIASYAITKGLYFSSPEKFMKVFLPNILYQLRRDIEEQRKGHKGPFLNYYTPDYYLAFSGKPSSYS